MVSAGKFNPTDVTPEVKSFSSILLSLFLFPVESEKKGVLTLKNKFSNSVSKVDLVIPFFKEKTPKSLFMKTLDFISLLISSIILSIKKT